jgi:hypothetical protein
LKVDHEKLKEVASKIIEGLKAKGDKVDKMGIEVQGVSAVLLNQIQEKGIENGIRDTCNFYGLDDTGAMSIQSIVMLGFGIMVMSYIIPMALTNFYAADTTQFCKTDADGNKTPDTMTQNLWYFIPPVIVLAILLIYIRSHQG